jgi:SAM-dependent methyltransferase
MAMDDNNHRVHVLQSKCRLCQSHNLDLVFKLQSTPPANAFVPSTERGALQTVYPLDVYFCASCFHVQLLDVVSAEHLFRDYVYVSGTSPSFVKHFELYAKSLWDFMGLDHESKVFEIGSNDGTMLRFFKERGAQVLGIDPAIRIAQAASDEGLLTINDFFTSTLACKVRHEYGPCDVIIANNVFAHIDDLGDVTMGVKTLLADEGVFAFEVSYLGDVIEKTLFDTIYHEHLSYHSVIALQPFFRRFGLELFKVERVNTHGGSLRGWVMHKGAHHRPDRSVEEWIEREKAQGLSNIETFRQFYQKISNLKKDLNSLIKELKSQGKSIAGFGAPAKATTLMYEFGLGIEMIDFIVDDSPLKQGLLTPGLHIPVYPVAALYDRKPDYTLILAWNFAESIIKNHGKHLQEGGRFIVPIPEVAITPPSEIS